MNRRSITLVVVVVLCVVGFAYGQGWLHWTSAGSATESSKNNAHQELSRDKTTRDPMSTTQQAEAPADRNTK
jgi:hypothetical protein